MSPYFGLCDQYPVLDNQLMYMKSQFRWHSMWKTDTHVSVWGYSMDAQKGPQNLTHHLLKTNTPSSTVFMFIFHWQELLHSYCASSVDIYSQLNFYNLSYLITCHICILLDQLTFSLTKKKRFLNNNECVKQMIQTCRCNIIKFIFQYLTSLFYYYFFLNSI